MSDDIDRLKYQTEDLRVLGDGLRDLRDALNGVVAAVKPIDRDVDWEGHVELRDHAFDVLNNYLEIETILKEVFAPVALLVRKTELL